MILIDPLVIRQHYRRARILVLGQSLSKVQLYYKIEKMTEDLVLLLAFCFLRKQFSSYQMAQVTWDL